MVHKNLCKYTKMRIKTYLKKVIIRARIKIFANKYSVFRILLHGTYEQEYKSYENKHQIQGFALEILLPEQQCAAKE